MQNDTFFESIILSLEKEFYNSNEVESIIIHTSIFTDENGIPIRNNIRTYLVT